MPAPEQPAAPEPTVGELAREMRGLRHRVAVLEVLNHNVTDDTLNDLTEQEARAVSGETAEQRRERMTRTQRGTVDEAEAGP